MKPRYRFSCLNCTFQTDSHKAFIEHVADEYKAQAQILPIEILDDFSAFNPNSQRSFNAVQ